MPDTTLEAGRLADWVREHGAAVRGYLHGLVRRSDLADDLAQEVFRKVWQARDRYEERGTPRAFLLRIADRVACDWARRQGREVTLDADAWRQVEPADETGDPRLGAAAAETARRLAQALDQLTAAQRRILLLRFYGELEFAEIAAQLDCPLGTVLSHCHRGLQALRSRFAESDDGGEG